MNSRYSNIRVFVAYSLEEINAPFLCAAEQECDTIKEAKDFARYSLTREFQQSGEFSEPLNVSRIVATDSKNGRECEIAEYWRKGWSPAKVEGEE